MTLELLFLCLFPILYYCCVHSKNRRRYNQSKESLLSSLNLIYIFITDIHIKINESIEDDDDSEPELKHIFTCKYFVNNYKRMIELKFDLKLYSINSNLSTDEMKNIQNIILALNQILDKYAPQNIPQNDWLHLWSNDNKTFIDNARTIIISIKSFKKVSYKTRLAKIIKRG